MITKILKQITDYSDKIRMVLGAFCLGFIMWQLHLSPYFFRPSSVEDVRIWVASYGSLAAVVYIALYTARPILLFPSIFLNLSASILFGPYLGIIYLLLGGLGSAILCYLLGSCGGGKKLLTKYGGHWGERLTNYLNSDGAFVRMLWLRTVPIFPYDPVSIIAGCCGMKLGTYIVATLLGMLPGAIAYNLLADSFTSGNSIVISVLVVLLAFGVPMLCWSLGSEHKKIKG